LDVGVDFFFILSTSGILCFQGNLPFWMIAVIIAKMFEFVVTSRVLRKRRSGPVFDLIGRLVAVGFYLLPILVILLRERKSFAPLLQILPFVIAAGALLSTVRRISRCVRRD
ncbi:MAG: hypothetical protein Q4A41_00520, partial [Bacillota bacterium]|nr:hypothetical protein [Bacillota bacterium]